MSLIATIVTVAFILLLFRMDREEDARVSWALWIPTLWYGVICSRPVSFWIHPNQSTDFMDRFTESSPIDATFYGLLILLAVLVLNRRADRVKSFLQVNLPVLLFFFYAFVSLSWSDDPAIAVKRWVKAVGDFAMILVVLTDPAGEAAVRRMFARVGFVLWPLSFLFILFYPSIGTMYDATEHVTMYTGVSTFKNLLGVACMVVGLASLWSFISAYKDRGMLHRARHMFAHGASFLMAAGLLVRANSMTSLSSFAFASVVMLVATTRRAQRRPALVLAMVLAVIGMAGFTLFFSSGGLLEDIGRNPTLTGRTLIWRAVLAQHINPLIGAGFESFWMGDRMQSVWSMSQVGIQQAHDGYLELYLNLGWIGITLLGFIIVTGYRNAFNLYKRDPTAGMLRIALITAGVVFGFTEAGFRMMSPDWIGFLLAVTAMPWCVAPQPQPDSSFVLRGRQAHSEMRILQ